MKTLIRKGTLVNEGHVVKADVLIVDDRIEDIIQGGIDTQCANSFDVIIDAEDAYVLPGVIDSHVHFREPGLTHKADMETESRAAAYGGVTTVFDMPNTKPQTTTLAALAEKMAVAREKMHVNYAFFPGATNDNIDELRRLNVHEVPGIKLFMGSSTGNMLVDKEQALDEVFALAKEMGLPLMAHCEDTETINANMAYYKHLTGKEDPDIQLHPLIRSEEACVKSSELGVRLARKHGTQFHIAHVTTEKELALLGDNITGEATVAHLMFSAPDYDILGALIKCNPAVKMTKDREALRRALTAASNAILTVSTDHAPHALEEKQGGAARAMSGMPMVQFSLISMLSLVDEKVLGIERVVDLMCHNQARLFSVRERGFLRKGYKADVAVVRRSDTPWTLTKDVIQSKCGWSPMEGRQFNWHVCQTMVDGRLVYDNGCFNGEVHGEQVAFR